MELGRLVVDCVVALVTGFFVVCGGFVVVDRDFSRSTARDIILFAKLSLLPAICTFCFGILDKLGNCAFCPPNIVVKTLNCCNSSACSFSIFSISSKFFLCSSFKFFNFPLFFNSSNRASVWSLVLKVVDGGTDFGFCGNTVVDVRRVVVGAWVVVVVNRVVVEGRVVVVVDLVVVVDRVVGAGVVVGRVVVLGVVVVDIL